MTVTPEISTKEGFAPLKLSDNFFTYVTVLYLPVYLRFYDFYANNKSEFTGKEGLLFFIVLFHILPAFLIALAVFMASNRNRRLAEKLHTAMLVLPIILLGTTTGHLGFAPWLSALAVAVLAVVSGLIGFYFRLFLSKYFKVAGYLVLVYLAYFIYSVGVIEEYSEYSLYKTGFSAASADADRDNPPTFVLILDEFSLLPLLDKNGEISEEFPNFKSLSKEGLWFRYAATNYDGTSHSIPSMLLGRFLETGELGMEGETDPTWFRNRPNLFNIAAGKYQISVLSSIERPLYCTGKTDFECIEGNKYWVSDYRLLGPISSSYSLIHGFVGVSSYSLCRFIRYIFGLSDWDLMIKKNIQHLLEIAGEKDLKERFVWFHARLPHRPWIYDRNGKIYRNEDETDSSKFALKKEIVEEKIRHFKEQVKYTDTVIGELIKRLKANGNWEKINLIITSDHGVIIEEGRKYRKPGHVTDEETRVIDQLARVPMFIKPAGIQKGETRDDYFQHINLLPTVLEMMNLATPEKLHGYSVLSQRKYLPSCILIELKQWWCKENPTREWEEVKGEFYANPYHPATPNTQ